MLLWKTIFIIMIGNVFHSEGNGHSCDGTTAQLTATETKAFIESPNYPNQYHDNELCRWVIEVRENYEVVRLKVMDLQLQKSAMCSEDYVEIKDGKNNWSPSIRRWCDVKDKGSLTTSTEQSVLVTFKSNGQFTDVGFKIQYWSVPKGTVEYLPVVLDTIHYLLFGVFGVIMASIFLTMVTIAVIRKHRLPRSLLRPSVQRKNHLVDVDVKTPDANDYGEAVVNSLQFRISSDTICEDLSTSTTPV